MIRLCSRTAASVAALALSAPIPTAAQGADAAPFKLQGGVQVRGMVLLCAIGATRDAGACGNIDNPIYVMSMPFVRATQDVNRFEGVSTTAKTFAISRPPGATSYRFVNPCDVPVRIRKVSSASELITRSQGTLFLQNTVETLGTSDPQFVSLIAMREPTGECTPELGYGNGG